MLTRKTIDDPASERATDETVWIDTADARTQNLLQVGAECREKFGQ
jgi:hypothetical protein